jgi:lysophospholipase L1-like esterase
MDWYEGEVRQLEAARRLHPGPPNPVVFYGSSTIRQWESLARDLGNTRALNLGFGGSTLEACVHFFDRIVLPAEPCSLVVYAGDNDLGDGRTPLQVLSLFRELAAKVKRHLTGVEFGFISIKPSPARWSIADRIRSTNNLIRQEIKTYSRGYFIDLFDAMLDKNGLPRKKLFDQDGLHLSPAGYRLWAQELSPYRNRIFTLDCSSIKRDGLLSSQREP